MISLGATLVADDRVNLARRNSAIFASAPDTIAGLIEARGIGLLRMDHRSDVQVFSIIDLDRAETDRLPQSRTRPLLDVPCPVIFGKDRTGLAAILVNLLRFGGIETGKDG